MKEQVLHSSIQILEDVCARYPQFTFETSKNIKQLRNDIDAFSAYVPFIGLFSAGKSALLNSYMGADILPVDQPATTSLATELRFGPEKQLIIIGEDGDSKIVEKFPSNAEEANATIFSEYLKAVYFVPSKNLQELSGIIPVDMPGTDSGIESHTRALFQYLHQGVAFVVVVDAASGTLPPTIGQILQNVDKVKKRVILVVHKSDKYTEEKISTVSAHLTDQIHSIISRKPTLLVTSILDTKTPELLHEVLSSLDVQHILFEEFTPIVNQISIRLANHITALSKSINEDLSELDFAIYTASQAKKDAEALFEKNRRKIQNEFSELAMRKAIAELNDNFESNIENICDAAMENEHSLSIRVTSIVENSIVKSLRKSIDLQVDTMTIQLESLDSLDVQALQGAIKSATTGTMTVLSAALKGLEVGSKLYKILSTTLAVMTNLVAPIVEILIIFLPEIINFFSDQTEKRRQYIKGQLRSRLFPDLSAKLESALRTELPELGQRAFEAMESDIKAFLDEREATLKEALRQKNEHIDNIEQRKNTYANDIRMLKSLADKTGGLM